jgi:uncharacterized damage-inducible protein DinB
MIESFRRWFDFECEAFGLALGSLRSVPDAGRGSPEFRKAASILGHMVAARRIWLWRLGEGERPAALFPEVGDLDALEADWEGAAGLWTAKLGRLTDEDLAQVMTYSALDGASFRSRLEDILTQLHTHAPYHRGQVAMLVKAAGGTPALTDFIYLTREAAGA